MSRLAMGVIDGSHGLQSILDGRFGRTPAFVVVDSETGQLLEVLDNEGRHAGHGAGLSAAALVQEHAIDGVVAAHFGPKASQTLQAMGIEMLLGTAGETVARTLDAFGEGLLGRESGRTP